jgi:tryptophan synthase alpha chain
MNRISDIFHIKKPFIAYITAGDPNLQATQKTILEMEKRGVDIIELGLPFSDSIADGPVIQASHLRAIHAGANLEKILNMVGHLRKKTRIPIIFMGSYHLFYTYGLEKTIQRCKEVYVDGLLAPDLPAEEGEAFSDLCFTNQINSIFLASTTTSEERLQKIGELSRGFIYLISRAGITGEQSEMAKGLKEKINQIRQITGKPVAVGFGISTPNHVKNMAKIADGVIVGSSIVKYMKTNPETALKWTEKLLKGMPK